MREMENKRLRRSRDGKMLGGICSGLGKYLGIDPVVVRLVFAVSALWAGCSLFAYLVMWLVIPEEDDGQTTPTFAE